MGKTAIEWATDSWNPVTGCDRVSPGCAHCYALELAARLKAMGQARYQRDGGRSSGPGFGVTLHEDKLTEPLRWRKPRRVFVNSMSDLFHEEVPDRYIESVFAAMALAPQHTFQVLTKRPERMVKLLNNGGFHLNVLMARWRLAGVADDPGASARFIAQHPTHPLSRTCPWPLPNVWLGVSIENRRFVHRADLLRDTPAAVRFISAEPLLGPLLATEAEAHGFGIWPDGVTERDYPELDLDGIDWLIAGGESGPNARRINPEWVRELRDHCEALDVAFFFKQWGGRTPKSGGRELDGRTWDEFPRAMERAT